MMITACLLAIAGIAGAQENEIHVTDVLVTIDEQVDVPARTSGTLVQLKVREGDEVIKDQHLGTIDYDDARLQRDRAKVDHEAAAEEAKNDAMIRLANKNLELATSELNRGRQSQAVYAGSITDEELGTRQLAVDKARLEVEQAKHEAKLATYRERLSKNDLENAERQLMLCRVAAPISGIVVQRERRQGEWVDTGQTVLKIMGIESVRAEAYVDASQLTSSLVGRKVVLEIDAGDQTKQFDGVLRFESSEINPVDGRVRVWAEIDNPMRMLKPGVRGRMTIQLSAAAAEAGNSQAAAK